MGAATRIVVHLPEGAAAGDPSEPLAERLRRLWVLDEVRQGRMTRVRAAHELAMSLDAFFELADRHGVYALDYDEQDFLEELDSLAPRRASAGATAERTTVNPRPAPA